MPLSLTEESATNTLEKVTFADHYSDAEAAKLKAPTQPSQTLDVGRVDKAG